MGINTEHRGLATRLLRSASLLGAIALLRFAFVLGVLHVRAAAPSTCMPLIYCS